jgi:hypothetical protein
MPVACDVRLAQPDLAAASDPAEQVVGDDGGGN